MVFNGEDSIGSYWQCTNGHRYYYNPFDSSDSMKAYDQANQQYRAIMANLRKRGRGRR